MSRKSTSLTKLERDLRKAERALMLAGLHEDVYCARKRPGRKTVRAVLHDGENVELVSSDDAALDGVYNALTSGRGEVSATKLRPVSEDELVKALGQGEGDTPTRLLGRGDK
jgi:hypothetical protein